MDQSGPVSLTSSRVTNNNPDVARIEDNARTTVVDNLPTYQFKPKGKKGVDLFAHMIGFQELTNNGTNGRKFTVSGSSYLDLNKSADNFEVLVNTNRLIASDSIESKRLIFIDATGSGAKKK